MAKNTSKKTKAKTRSTGSFWDIITRGPWVYLVFFALAFIIYGQVLNFFLGKFDEDLIVLGNLNVLKSFDLKLAFTRDAFLSDKGVSFYRPLQAVSYMIDAQFFRTQGTVFYFTNILIHAATCSALFRLLTLLGRNRRAAFILALVFLAAPLFVQAIAWAPSRGDLLIGLAGLLAFIAFIRLTETKKMMYGLLCVLAFAVAMFSKETAILIPLMIFAWYFLLSEERKIPVSSLAVTIGGFLVVATGYFYLRSKVVILPSPAAEFGLAPFLNNLRTIPEYIAKFIVPAKLCPMPGFTMLNTLLGIFLFLVLAALAWKYRQSATRGVLFGFAWFLVFALPGVMYSHTLGSAAYDYLEHRAYLPAAGLIIALLYLFLAIQDEKTRNRIAGYALIVVLAFGIYSFSYAKYYENPMVFYDHITATNPASAMAYSNRGLIKAEGKDYQGAIADYEKAIAVKHNYAQAWVNKGISLMELGDTQGAIVQYDSAVKFKPDLFQAHFNRANAKSKLGLYEEALAEYTKAMELYPTWIACYTARGEIWFRLKNNEAAEKDFREAIRRDSRNVNAWVNLGKLSFNAGKRTEACTAWSTARDLGDNEARELMDKFCQ